MNKFNSLNEDQKKKVKKEIQVLLSKSILSFSFVKKDGTVRQSLGCLDEQIIESNGATPKSKPVNQSEETKESPVNLVKYFDMDKKSWRSFNIESLTEIMQIQADNFIDKVISE